MTDTKCKYCGGDIAIRNPTGRCDHLYYPEYCEGYLNEQKRHKPQDAKTIEKETIQRCIEAIPREVRDKYIDGVTREQISIYNRGFNECRQEIVEALKEMM